MGFLKDFKNADQEVTKILENLKEHPELIEKFKQEHPEYSDNYVVKCPTCGCPKVRRITGTEKLTSTVAFGFFSNKRRQQFECLNPKCRYKW